MLMQQINNETWRHAKAHKTLQEVQADAPNTCRTLACQFSVGYSRTLPVST
jgi:hypothetical protein